MLYHHQQEEESVPSVFSRLPSVEITSEDTEAELEDTAEVRVHMYTALYTKPVIAGDLPGLLAHRLPLPPASPPGGAPVSRDHRVCLPQGRALKTEAVEVRLKLYD